MKLETMDKKPTNDAPTAERNALVGHVQVTCEAILGSGKLTIAELEKLKVGDVVPLDRSPADPVEVWINGKVIARGEIVTLDNRFAVRLIEVG